MLSRSRTSLLRQVLPSVLNDISPPCTTYPSTLHHHPHPTQSLLLLSHQSFSTFIDRTTLPNDGGAINQPGVGGIEGQRRRTPTTAEPEKKEAKKKESAPEPTQSGEASVPPPFNPSDPEEKKKLRAAKWGEEPPKEREPGGRRPSKVIPLTDRSLSVEFMDKLRGCTTAPKIEHDGTIKYEMIKLLNLRKIGVPIVSRLVTDHREGMEGALRFISKAFDTFNINTLDDCCSDVLSKRLSAIIEELINANAKLVIDIDKVVSAQIFSVDVITPEGARHDTLKGDFPYFRLMNTKPSVEFEGCLEVDQKIYIIEKDTGKVLFGSKDPITAYHNMKFKSDLTPILPGFPQSLKDFKPWCDKLVALDAKELLGMASNPFKVSPWVLLDIDSTTQGKTTEGKA